MYFSLVAYLYCILLSLFHNSFRVWNSTYHLLYLIYFIFLLSSTYLFCIITIFILCAYSIVILISSAFIFVTFISSALSEIFIIFSRKTMIWRQRWCHSWRTIWIKMASSWSISWTNRRIPWRRSNWLTPSGPINTEHPAKNAYLLNRSRLYWCLANTDTAVSGHINAFGQQTMWL